MSSSSAAGWHGAVSENPLVLKETLQRRTEELEKLRGEVEELRRDRDSLLSSQAKEREAFAGAPILEVELHKCRADLEHERQRADAIWAAIRSVAGDAVMCRVEEEVERRPIVSKAKRRGSGGEGKRAAAIAAEELAAAAVRKMAPAASPALSSAAEIAEVVEASANVDIVSVSVARKLFDGGLQGHMAATTAARKEESSAEVVPADEQPAVPVSVARRAFMSGATSEALKGSPQPAKVELSVLENMTPQRPMEQESLILPVPDAFPPLKFDELQLDSPISSVPSPLRRPRVDSLRAVTEATSAQVAAMPPPLPRRRPTQPSTGPGTELSEDLNKQDSTPMSRARQVFEQSHSKGPSSKTQSNPGSIQRSVSNQVLMRPNVIEDDKGLVQAASTTSLNVLQTPQRTLGLAKADATPQMGSSVRDRVRKLEQSAGRHA